MLRRTSAPTLPALVNPHVKGIGLVLVLMFCMFLLYPQVACAQVILGGVIPQAGKPGKAITIEFTGQNFKVPMRLSASFPCETKWLSVEPTKAVAEVLFPETVPLGPITVWLATDDAVSDSYQFLLDDLESVRDNGTNHLKEQAQGVVLPCAVDGKSDAAQSDFYSVMLEAGFTISVDCVAERLGSTMDPVVRIWGPQGTIVQQFDDSPNGPDVQATFTASVAGPYLIEVVDSRYAGEGRYRLRLGSFTTPAIPYPFVIHPKNGSAVRWIGADGSQFEAPSGVQSFDLTYVDRTTISAVSPSGSGGVWGEVLVRDFQTAIEPIESVAYAGAVESPLPIPVGISGRLTSEKEVDSYVVAGVQGQVVRIQSRTRSLGLATLLKLAVFDAAGNRVAESGFTDEDSVLDMTFPATGTYTLKVTEWLGRFGPLFGYCVEIMPKSQFSFALKADPKGLETRLMESGSGAAYIDLLVQRVDYEGPIQLETVGMPNGLRILNPTVPAQAKEHRLYFAADNAWPPNWTGPLHVIGKAPDTLIRPQSLQTLAQRRARLPHQPFPSARIEGQFAISALPGGEPFFGLDVPQNIALAAPWKQHVITTTVKRLKETFKEPISVLSVAGPQGWTVQPALDKDILKLTMVRMDGTPVPAASPLTETPELKFPAIQLAVYGQTDRGRIESFSIPFTWFEPMNLVLEPVPPILPGASYPLTVKVERKGFDAVPSTIQLKDLPAGLVCDPVVLAADQSSVQLILRVASDFVPPVGPVVISAVATTKVAENEWQTISPSVAMSFEPLPAKLEAFPSQVTLRRGRDQAGVVLTGWDSVGVPRDWTSRVQWMTINPAVAVVRNGKIYPVANGQTEVVAQLGPHRSVVPVTVSGLEQPARVEFENEVLVALSKQGCNSGACHGSPSGKGSFRLSLRAFDSVLDALTLVREETERRINPIEPEKSLLLTKPLMKVPHGGGTQLHKDDAAYQILVDWIAQGAPLDPPSAARCIRLEVFPNGERVLAKEQGEQQLVVIAHFADGTSRDVTNLCAYESSNTSVAEVNVHGKVRPSARGESVILVRFLEHIESIPFLFVEQIPGFEWKPQPEQNFIDTLVDAKLKQLQFEAAPLCADDVFLRRIYLDLLGVLPTVEESIAFLNDRTPDKRNRLIDELLVRPEHAKFWALKWGDLLKMTSKAVGNEGVFKYYRWVEQAIRENMPYDQFARALLSANGSTYTNPPANFYRTSADMNESVETISQVFLGARLQCAKCHNHPFERWTQDNYYGLGAFFQRVQRSKTARPNEMLIWTQSVGEVVQPRTGQTMKPWVPVAGSLEIPNEVDRREAFVAWLIRPENPYLARVEANRIWSQLFARGIVDPIDDFRDSNPPTNRPLLDALTKQFVDSGYNRRELIRTILQSRTYQASYETTAWNEKDQLYFSHQHPRLLSAEQLLDAINQLTQTDQPLVGLPVGTKATQIPAPDLVKVDFLKVFGQPERSTVCACERSEDSNLGMAIELFNGSTVYEKLKNPNNRFRRLIAEGKGVDEVIRQMYLAGLSRLPTEQELQEAVKHCQSKPDPLLGLEDLCWVLINTDEFLFQH
jgi:hypothetical protein